MGTITERKDKSGNTTFQVKVRIKGTPVQTATFDRKTDAKRWEQQTESAIRENRFFPHQQKQSLLLSELIERYIETILPRKTPKIFKLQKQQLMHWHTNYGGLNISEITSALVAEERDKLATGLTPRGIRSPATVNRYLGILRHVFTIAIKEWQVCKENPVSNVSKLKEMRGRTRYLSIDERKALLQTCKQSDNPYLYIIVVLALSTGARKNEIMSLKWKNVHIDREVIILQETKNGEIRSIPLQGHGLQLLKRLSEHSNQNPSDYLFKSPNNDKPIDIRTAWENALKKADILNFRFHDLRHTTASYLAMNGASLTDIAEILGHKTLHMVKRYAHLSEAHTKKVVSDMNSKIFDDVGMKEF